MISYPLCLKLHTKLLPLLLKHNSTQIMYTDVDETVIVIYDNKNDKKGDYVLTLYTSISNLKEVQFFFIFDR